MDVRDRLESTLSNNACSFSWLLMEDVGEDGEALDAEALETLAGEEEAG